MDRWHPIIQTNAIRLNPNFHFLRVRKQIVDCGVCACARQTTPASWAAKFKSQASATSSLKRKRVPEQPLTPDYGLRREVLSPMETLAQSVSTMAPTTTPVATIPLVCALAGNATWLAYLLATSAVLLVGSCVARYARYSASPGSLYTYASMTLPPWLSAVAAWSLLLAYVGTG